jgi:hypothetical protein
MFDLVAVGAKDNALGDLALDGDDRAIVLHHFPDGEVFLLPVGVI